MQSEWYICNIIKDTAQEERSRIVQSKAAVIGLTKHTALRFQKDGIRCNAICPGNIITPMTMGTDPKALDPDIVAML